MIPALVNDELDVLRQMVPLDHLNILELGCGAAKLARDLMRAHPGNQYTGLEVDLRQHAANLTQPQEGMRFEVGVAQSIHLPDQSVDLVLMLKSLHHVPLDQMANALAETARVLKPGGHLYVSEPVYDGALNDIVRIYNDEGTVRAAAQAAVDQALAASNSPWVQVRESRFDMPVRFKSFEEFETRMMRPTFADHHLDDDKIARTRAAFLPHLKDDGAAFTRPMHVRLLQRRV
ncbi:MAG: class I SAM-dependent methyltransferase [Burkholderiales bacterium]|nr:class I SAM-dependent methyltransferase [Burkholderiales bacterium]MDE2432312.1 class I SAM-dependent methyltransferase [Burkholderiales bacterium]